jgi:nitrate/nitrite-specific signal transduction histidine kinase
VTISDLQQDTSPIHPDSPAQHLRRRYVAGLASVGLIVLLSQIAIQYAISQQTRDSHIINLAGRQRMLSQRLSKAALGLLTAAGQTDLERYGREMEEALSTWSETHAALQTGELVFSVSATTDRHILEEYQAIELDHQAMLDAGRALLDLSLSANPGVVAEDEQPEEKERLTRVLLSHETRFLNGMDKIVFAYDANARTKVWLLSSLELALAALLLLVLLLLAIFVFQPAVRLIQQQFQQLTQTADTLRDTLFMVRQLRGLLPICCSCKKIRDGGGNWTRLEAFISARTDAEFTHSVCPECSQKLYPEPDLDEDGNRENKLRFGKDR